MPMAEQQRATLCNRLWVSGCEALGDVCTRCGRWGLSGTVGLGMCDKCVPLARQTTLILPGPDRRRNPKRRRSPSAKPEADAHVKQTNLPEEQRPASGGTRPRWSAAVFQRIQSAGSR